MKNFNYNFWSKTPEIKKEAEPFLDNIKNKIKNELTNLEEEVHKYTPSFTKLMELNERTKMSLIESQGELESNYPTENTA